MQLTKRRRGNKDLRDEEIRARIAAAEQTISEVDRLPPGQVRGKEAETLTRYERALEIVDVGRAELASREHELIAANAPARRALRDEEDARRARHKALAPVVGALEVVRRRAHPELAGATLAADRLSETEAAELVALVNRFRRLVFEEDAEPLTEPEAARYELLVGAAAGDPELFARKRHEKETREKVRALGKQRRVALLPRRPRLEEPGSVTLPRSAAHTWLADGRKSAWTVADVGALVAILGCFENRDGSVINARFEERQGEPMLVVSGGVGAELRFARAIGGDSVDPTSSGFVRLRSSLATLVRNQWLEVEVDTAETTITLGPRAKDARGQNA